MAKKSESVQVFHVPAPSKSPTVDPFVAEFERVAAERAKQEAATSEKREQLRSEFAALVWRRANGKSLPTDATRLVQMSTDPLLDDLLITPTSFEARVAVCRRWQAMRDQFLQVPELQRARDLAHERVRQLTEELRAAESSAAASAGQLMLAHSADHESKSIARGNGLLFDVVTGQPRDGSELSIEQFSNQKG